MRTGTLLGLAAALAGTACGAATQDTVFTPRAEIADSVDAVFGTLNAAAVERDLERFMSVWARTDSLVYSRQGRTFIGWEEVAANHRQAFDGPAAPRTAERDTLFVTVLGSGAAVGTAFTRMSGQNADGTPTEGWFIVTATLNERPEGWRIVQAHSSYAPPGARPRR